MFRWIGIVVVAAVMAPSLMIFADLLQSPEDRLPACCRRDGKHHCAMMKMDMAMDGAPPADKQVKAMPPACPFRSHPASVSYVVSYLPAASTVYFSGLQSHPAIHAQTFASFRIAENRSHLKRGPPADFLP